MATRAKVVPELGFMGWISDPLKKVDMLFSHVLESDFSQSTIYQGKVTSLPYIIARHQHDPLELQGEIQIQLSAYFGRYFEIASVLCKSGELNENNQYPVSLSISVQENGKLYELVNTLFLENGKVVKVLNEVNK